jgi:hypothetical protein
VEAPPAATPTPPPDTVYPPSWRARLGQEPEELIWPGYRGVATRGYDREMQAFRMTSDFPRLIKLGELPAGPCTVSVGIRQAVWNGAAGVFLGYGIETHKERPRARFQYLAITKQTDPAGGVALVLRRSITAIDPPSGAILTVKELGYQKLKNWPPPGAIPRLELQVGPDGLVAARWGEQEVPDVTGAYQNGKLTRGDYAGAWGLVNQYETTWFQDPAVIAHPEEGAAK